jgi:hypothetical protein
VRAVLGPVVDLAAEIKVAIVGIMHFNKKIDITNVLLRIGQPCLRCYCTPRLRCGQ